VQLKHSIPPATIKSMTNVREMANVNPIRSKWFFYVSTETLNLQNKYTIMMYHEREY